MSYSSRRTFIQALGTAAFMGPSIWTSKGASAAPIFSPAGKSRVVIARDDSVLTPPNVLDAEKASQLLDRAMTVLSDKKDPVDPWRALFKSTDVVGIKVNVLGGRMLSPQPLLVNAIVRRLAQAGVPEERIIIWDRSERELKRAGYDKTVIKGRAVILGTDSKGVGFEREPEMSGSIGSCFSRIVSKACTALINVGVFKDHDLSGISVAMKNLFGLIHNPNRYHFDVHKDPYLPDLCLHPYVKDKLRLNICDGFRGQYDGGPSFKSGACWNYGGLFASFDPVAMDTTAAGILDKKRVEKGLATFKDTDREPLYLQLSEEKQIGFTDPAKIDVKEISL